VDSDDLLQSCMRSGNSISEIVFENEKAWRTDADTRAGLQHIWAVMEDCIFDGCHAKGILPGGLHVKRRAFDMHKKLLVNVTFDNRAAWRESLKNSGKTFPDILNWVSCFALAVNEQNAAFGRVVTAPTNGAAGVIPAVIMYQQLYTASSPQDIETFLSTAAQIGMLF
jgi:L-serine dehydratase